MASTFEETSIPFRITGLPTETFTPARRALRRGVYVFIPPGVPHDIRNPGEAPARLLMTVSPPGHEEYFKELPGLTALGRPDPAALRWRFDIDQLSTLTVAA